MRWHLLPCLPHVLIMLLRVSRSALWVIQVGDGEESRAAGLLPPSGSFGCCCVVALQAHGELEALEEQMLQMQESAHLFEVALPEDKQLKQCRREMKLLKALWDVIIYVTVRGTPGKHTFFLSFFFLLCK